MIKAEATFLGHSTVLIEMGGVRILTDPVLFDRITILRRRVSPLPSMLYERIDLILISHLHLDHLDIPSLLLLGINTPLVVPRGAQRMLRRWGFRNVVELSSGQAVMAGRVRVTATPAAHSGFRPPFGPNAEALGYLVDDGDERVYFAGDTDVFAEMANLADIDLALLPVWGWGPRLGPGHMDPRRAAEALTVLRPRVVVPIHWGTLWPMGMGRVMPHRLALPPLEFEAHAAQLAPNVRVFVTPPGETVLIPR